MARTPSMTPGEAETALGRTRGHLFVTAENTHLARKWLTAMGLPGIYAAGLARPVIAKIYNDETNAVLAEHVNLAIAAKLADDNDDESPAVAPFDANAMVVQLPQPGANGHAAPNGNGHDLAAAIRAIAASVIPTTPSLDIEAIRGIIREETAGIAPREILVRQPNADAVQINGIVHPLFERVLNLVSCGANVLMVGPAGCGKTHMAEQISRALNATYGAIHGSAGASESALTGWLLPSNGGAFEYVASPFVTLYEAGSSLFLFDELDAFDPNMLLVVNGALANGHIHIAHRKDMPCVKRGKGAMIMATANTYGTGANPMYSGRSPLDAATLDRFIVVTMDYDRKLEESIGHAGGLSAAEMADIWSLRDKVREAQLRRCVSTRAFQKASIMKAAGDKWNTVKATLVEGWTKDEKAKVGM